MNWKKAEVVVGRKVRRLLVSSDAFLDCTVVVPKGRRGQHQRYVGGELGQTW